MKASLHELFKRLGVHTRAQLVGIALDQYKDEL
jgi:DNA-binding NarL/FixJ family response regulator